MRVIYSYSSKRVTFIIGKKLQIAVYQPMRGVALSLMLPHPVETVDEEKYLGVLYLPER